MAEEYTAARAIFLSDTVTPLQAADTLARVWVVHNDTEKDRWQQSIDEAAAEAVEALRLRAEADAKKDAAAEAEQLEAEKEALKRYRTKHIPIPDRAPPRRPTVTPSPYALRKLQKGDYVEMYYFTNEALAEARKSSSHADDEAMLPITDPITKTMSWIPAAAKRDSAVVVPDKDLTWNQFSIAIPRMLEAMHKADWPAQRTNMLAAFWGGILNHEYRSSVDDVDVQTLLVFQGEQRWDWHQAIDTPEGAWNIGIIDPSIMRDTKERVFNEHRNRADLELRLRVSVLHLSHPPVGLFFSSRSIMEAPAPRQNSGTQPWHPRVQWHHDHSDIIIAVTSQSQWHHVHGGITPAATSHSQRHHVRSGITSTTASRL